jgi:hypothetical protein
MIDLIIYSKDRAAQLELLLHSVKEFCPYLFNISVIFKASQPKFQDAYDILVSQYPGWWFNESNHPGLTMQEITQHAMIKSHMVCPWTNWTMFSTDDQVFFKKLPVSNEELENHLPKTNLEVFSFRLGYNTIEQDIHHGTRQPPLNLHTVNGEVLTWSPYHYHPLHNYGYPLAVDCHVFRTSLIIDLFQKFSFKTTNELETRMQDYRNLIGSMSSFKNSVCVNVPANNLSGCTIAGQTHGYSVDFLNEQFLAGKRISLE